MIINSCTPTNSATNRVINCGLGWLMSYKYIDNGMQYTKMRAMTATPFAYILKDRSIAWYILCYVLLECFVAHANEES